jgi:glycosyltransferase involved in cell wall biosynthesis
MFEPGSAEALADGWEALLANPAEARALGERGRAAVEREFSMPRMAERFVALTKEFPPRTLAWQHASR